ncbi:MAG: GNAT family N-acetyltransferase [Saprospiraceae bacterium]|nr:GNAT family N-acetyltransferase [Saprospiraceae bacterium]
MKLPPFDNFPNISYGNISLRQIQNSDMNDLMDISCYNAIPASTMQEAIEMQARIDKDYMDGNSIHWGIVDNQTNKLVGTCGYYRGLNNGEGELGCVLLPRYRGQGFMTPAMLLAIDFGINVIGLKRIWAVTTTQNDKAIHLLKRLHFIKTADLQDDEIEFEYRPDIKSENA